MPTSTKTGPESQGDSDDIAGADKQVGTWEETTRLLKTFAKATRVQYLPVLITPLALGASLSWRDGNKFRPQVFALSVLGSTAAHLASNITNDYFDYLYGADQQADVEPGSIDTGSGSLTREVLSNRQVQGIMWSLYGTALASCVALARVCGPPVMVMGTGGFILGYFYTAPPVKLSYIGRGLGEVDLMLAFGILPALGAYYTQSRELSFRPAIASLPLGILTAHILFNHHFLHWRSDLASGKISPVAAMGEAKAPKVSRYIALSGFGSVLVGVATKTLPVGSVLVLALAPRLLRAIDQAGKSRSVPGYLDLLTVTLQTSIRTGALLVGAVTLSGIIRRFARRSRRTN